MNVDTIDWTIIVGFMVVTLTMGLAVMKRAGRSSADFFLAGRGMPWWLLGMSMVATTFSAGTPNFVTDIVRDEGVAGNWKWWAFLLTGMMTVFVYAKLWRRSGVMTDIEFYELRYSGRPAAFLRGFRALYLGVLFNVIVLASANLAAIKIGGAMLGTTPVQTVLIAGLVTAIYSMLGGLTGVLITDLLLFVISMGGAIAAAIYLLNLDCVGGLTLLLEHEAVRTKLSMFPDWSDPDMLVPIFVIPLAVQWWSVWYPGAEPGGGGYVAQRMLAAKNELHATGATLLFNVAHYALRPWPWILVAFCSIIVFPDLASLRAAFPHMPENVIKHDLAYPAMMTLLPSGLRGLVLASLMAAFMSTLSTHLNWGSSYVVNDFYKRFVRPEASEKQLVLAGRICTLLTMVAAALVGLALSNALQVFKLILQMAAGTGLVFLLRWFWWRINAFSEITAMVVALVVGVRLEFFEFKDLSSWEKTVAGAIFGPKDMSDWQKLVTSVVVTTVAWLMVTFLTRPTDESSLRRFCQLVRPGGPGWAAVVRRAAAEGQLTEGSRQRWNVPMEIVCMLIGCAAVYCALIATGYWIYGYWLPAAVLTGAATGCTAVLIATWQRVNVA